ncbi:MAG: polysaccharide deacetylase family protein [Candidatus Omnitrophica bacterium]|nr:polysaccharide deacetylase family protein [Candidatus Omnitrophota bacterium]
MKISLRIIIGLAIFLSALYFFWLSPGYEVPILTYHYFGNNGKIDGKDYPLLFVSPDNFEKQMRYLKEKGYRVVSLETLVDGIKEINKFPHNTVVITVDDGHKSFFTYAYPVLKKYGFPATVFLVSDIIGARQDYLDWDEIRQMFTDNISFGGHTRSHVYLPHIKNKDVLWKEIAGCKEVIEKALGKRIDYFSYPVGGFTKEARTLVEKAGYKGACSTNRSLSSTNVDVYTLRRVSVRNVNPYFSISNLFPPISFRAKLSGYYNSFREKKRK